MIGSNYSAYDTKRQHIIMNIFIFFNNSDTYDQNQRIHCNPLIPAKHTGRKAQNLAEIQTPSR